MKKLDYEKLGLKCGLEIHQQLDTKKLFCECQSILRQDEPDFTVKRKFHTVAGEVGEVDVAAKYQVSLNKEFTYEGYDTICLVELDEEPPHEINTEALKIALQISLLLNAKILPIPQIMRKSVIDGSNTSGFQRTIMIAHDGYIKTKHNQVRIEGIFLEEDSARTVKGNGIFRLDRLGIPLIEIMTAPDIKNSEEAKDVALHIGEILRSCKVKRGIGTIRQDLNISIKGSNRVEIKGFQDPKRMTKTIDLEIERQKNFLNKGKINPPEVRNSLPNGTTKFLRPMPGEARMYPETDLPLLKISRNLINNVKKNLPRLKSEVEKELKKSGLPQEMIKLIFKQNKLDDFKELISICDNARFVSRVLLIFPREIASKEKKSLKEIEEILNRDVLAHVLEKVVNKKISESDVKHVLERIVAGIDFNEAIKFEKEDLNVLEEKIMRIIKTKPNLSEKAYMGLIMKEFKGKISGKDAMKIMKKYVY
jgi:Glu-tRNA(Gln) amidotransferase subunit E-like FAD-binding protein